MFATFRYKIKRTAKQILYALTAMGLVIVMTLGMLLRAKPAMAQANPGGFFGVDQIITSPGAADELNFPDTPYADPCDEGSYGGCTGNTTNLTFGADNNLILDAVIVGGERFEPARQLLPPAGLPERLVFRRDPAIPEERVVIFFESEENNPPTDEISLAPERALTLEEAMLSQIINRGIDNVFHNADLNVAGRETRNNIQRIDYLITGDPPNITGIDLTTLDRATTGFLILERGGNDDFGIAAVTAVDGNGDPLTYGPLIEVDRGDWGNSGLAPIPTAVLRADDLPLSTDPTDPVYNPSHQVGPQSIEGIVFPINSLVDDTVDTIFGYSLFAADVGPGADLADFLGPGFSDTTGGGSGAGGLDLVAGGFGLVQAQQVPVGDFALTKRITNLAGPANVPDFTVVEGAGDPHVDLLQQEGLGQGVTTIADPPVGPGNEVEYTIYFSNIGAGPAEDVVICDQIPAALTFVPDAFGAGEGIQAIESSAPADPRVTYTNADDGDPGRFFQPGEALPNACGPDQGNGAVVVNVGDVGSNEVGLVTFRATVN